LGEIKQMLRGEIRDGIEEMKKLLIEQQQLTTTPTTQQPHQTTTTSNANAPQFAIDDGDFADFPNVGDFPDEVATKINETPTQSFYE